MNKNILHSKHLGSIVATSIILLSTTLLFTVSANQEEMTEEKMKHQEIKEEIVAAIEAEDYQAFAEATEDLEGHMAMHFENINEDNFSKLTELHEAKEAGDKEAAKEIAKELGMEFHKKGHKQKHFIKGLGDEDKAALKEAIETENYEAWTELMQDIAPDKDLTEEHFEKMIERYETREEKRAERETWLMEQGLSEEQITTLKNTESKEEKKELLESYGVEFPEREKKMKRG